MDYIIKPKKNSSPAKIAKRLGISVKQIEAQTRKYLDEFRRKQGVLGPELKPQERLELEEQAKSSSSFDKTWRKDARRRCGVSVPFPLPEIYYSTDDTKPSDGVYSHSDPEYLQRTSSDAFGAINDYRMFFYKPELYLNKGQLKLATDVALEIRAVYHDLRNIPLAENPDCPTDEDFIRLGQWFLDAHTAITEDIDSQSAKEKAACRKPLTTKAGLIYEKLKSLPEHKGMTLPEIQKWIENEHNLNLDDGTWKKIRKELIPYGIKNQKRIGYYFR